MSILSLFVVFPVLMLLGLWLARNLNQVRGVMVAGSSCLLILSIWLTVTFIQMRAGGNTDEMLFTYSIPWFAPLNIAYSVVLTVYLWLCFCFQASSCLLVLLHLGS